MYNVQNKCLQSYYNLFIAGGFKLLDINKFTEKLFLLTNSMLFTKEYLSVDSPSHRGYRIAREAEGLESYSDSPAFSMDLKLLRGPREN